MTIALSDAVNQLVADISDDELHNAQRQVEEQRQRRELPSYNIFNWINLDLSSKRDMAIRNIYIALLNGNLTAPPLSTTDWHEAKFWREIIISSYVHAQPGDAIWRYENKPLYLERAAFNAWLNARPRPPSQKPNEAASTAALEAEMRAHPKREQKPKSKNEFRKEHMMQFGVSKRQFDRIWDTAISNTGAEWNAPGAPSKLPK